MSDYVSGDQGNLSEHFMALTGDDTIYRYDNPSKLSDEYKEWLKSLKEFKKDSVVFNYMSEQLSELFQYYEPSFNRIENPLEKVTLINLPKLTHCDCDQEKYETCDWFELDIGKVEATTELEVHPKRLLKNKKDAASTFQVDNLFTNL